MAIPAYYSLIQKGSSGPDVALVQTWLNGIRDACTWHDILKADGRFGSACEKAVTEFQLRNKLKVDGKVGANARSGKNWWCVLYPGLCRSACGGYARPAENDLVCGGYVVRFWLVDRVQALTACRADRTLLSPAA